MQITCLRSETGRGRAQNLNLDLSGSGVHVLNIVEIISLRGIILEKKYIAFRMLEILARVKDF